MKPGNKNLFRFVSCAVIMAMFSGVFVGASYAASVAKRGTVSRAKVNAAARVPVVAKTPATEPATEPEPVVTPEPVVEEEEVFEFEDRTSTFDAAIGAGDGASGATSDEVLAKMIREQRDALNAADATLTVDKTSGVTATSSQNACDAGLRKCMVAKCGADFTKCSGDTETSWGNKMESCRRDLKCSGKEYTLFAAEIKADRDAYAELANFNAIINCGNRYNSCIIAECGATFSKCLGKKSGDAAIEKCKRIQTECVQQDSGLASRMMNVFASFRQDAEKQVQRDEARLYALRDDMESACRRLGALFDQRSLDCVYTVNFFADNATSPYASKKAYAGGVFSCDPGWFGIDVTTFKENAYRLTRAQTAASSAMLGSGIGMAAGAITSGAIDRALETQKAKKALKEAEAEHDAFYGDGQSCSNAGGTWNAKRKKCDCGDGYTWNAGAETCDAVVADEDTGTTTDAAERRCTKAGGVWENGLCEGAVCKKNQEWDYAQHKCVKKKKTDDDNTGDGTGDSDEFIETVEEEVEEDLDFDTTQVVCEDKGGTWNPKNSKCTCVNAKGKKITTKNPVVDCSESADVTTCVDGGGKWTGKQCQCQDGYEWRDNKCQIKAPDVKMSLAFSACTKAGGKWQDGKCIGAKCGNKKIWSDDAGQCVDDISDQVLGKTACEGPRNNGKWVNNTCQCPGDKVWNSSKNACEKKRLTQEEMKQTEAELARHTDCKNGGGKWDYAKNMCDCGTGRTWNPLNKKCEKSSKANIDDAKADIQRHTDCKNGGGNWDYAKNMCDCGTGRMWNPLKKKCEFSGTSGKKTPPKEDSDEKPEEKKGTEINTDPKVVLAMSACSRSGGTWSGTTCDCGTGKTWNPIQNKCTAIVDLEK